MATYEMSQTYDALVCSNDEIVITTDGYGEYLCLTVELVGINDEASSEIRDLIFDWVEANKANFPVETFDDEDEEEEE